MKKLLVVPFLLVAAVANAAEGIIILDAVRNNPLYWLIEFVGHAIGLH